MKTQALEGSQPCEGRQRLEGLGYKVGSTKDCQPSSEAAREAWERFSPRASEGSSPADTQSQTSVTSRTGREWISFVSSHAVCGPSLWQR